MDYDAEITSQKIVPLTGEVTVPISVSYKVICRFANWAAKYLSRKVGHVSIDLRIKEKPSWCSAMIPPNLVNLPISDQWQTEETYIHISFNENAPAYIPSMVVIEMYSPEISTFFYKIDSVTKTTEISFTPDYLPIIDATPFNNSQVTKPGKTVIFDIVLENLGNAKTEFVFNIMEIPEGWTANAPSNITIGSEVNGENPKNTVQFSVTPPGTIESQKTREVITLTVRGHYFGDATTGESVETPEYTMSFIVEVEDTSTPWFEPIVLILSIVIMALIIVIVYMALIIKKQHLS